MPAFSSAAGRGWAALLHCRSAGWPASAYRFSLVGKMECPAEKLKGQNEAEAEVDPVAKVVDDPERHPAAPSIEPAAAPAKHAITT